MKEGSLKHGKVVTIAEEYQKAPPEVKAMLGCDRAHYVYWRKTKEKGAKSGARQYGWIPQSVPDVPQRESDGGGEVSAEPPTDLSAYPKIDTLRMFRVKP